MARQLATVKGQGWKAAGFRHVAGAPIDIQHGPFSLNEVLDGAARLAESAGGGTRFAVADGVPADLIGDSVNLGRILAALTGNAPESVDANGLAAAVDVVGTLYDSGRRSVVLQFTVRAGDSGFTCEQAGDLLVQVCSAAVTGPGGDESAASVSVSCLIDDMGGSIAVASAPGEGFALSFTVAFGVAPAATAGDSERTYYGAGAGPQARIRMPEGLECLQGARVLLAEDHPVNQNLTREILTHAGCKVDIAADGQKTVDAVRDHAKSYDAVIMDVQMPIVDGFEATRIIREDLAKPDLPIIAMTANVLGDERERCLAVGMDDYVPKPIHVPDLYAALIRCIERSRPDAGGRAPGMEDAEDATDEAPAAGSEVPLPEDLPGVDIELGLARAMGNRELYAGLLAQFAKGNETTGADVDAAIAGGDLVQARKIVHDLVSTAGNVGADRLCAAARALEKALSEPTGDIGALAGGFRNHLDTVLEGLRQSGLMAAVGAVRLGDGATELDREEALRVVEDFAAMLDVQDMAARTHLDELLEMFGGRGQDAELTRMKARLDALEFPEAREILDRICKEIVP